jgi:hypothetical protein
MDDRFLKSAADDLSVPDAPTRGRDVTVERQDDIVCRRLPLHIQVAELVQDNVVGAGSVQRPAWMMLEFGREDLKEQERGQEPKRGKQERGQKKGS